MNKNVKILIVSDAASMRRIIVNLLRNAGYVNVVESGSLRIDPPDFQEGPFGIILLDWENTPDGALEFVRTISEVEAPPILVLAGEKGREDLPLIRQSGAADYILMPSPPDALAGKIRSVLSPGGASQ